MQLLILCDIDGIGSELYNFYKLRTNIMEKYSSLSYLI